MVKKKEEDVSFVRQFNDLKKKHPDAMLLFRKGDFYEMYKEDALKASVILALKVSEKVIPLEKDPIKLLSFPRHELDRHLPKLIRSGQRVAICDAIDRPELMKKAKAKEKIGEKEKTPEKAKEEIIPNKDSMARKKKEQAEQEKPVKTVKTAVEEKPAQEKKTEAKAEVKNEQASETKKERKPREPQMITANGEKA